MPYSTTIPNLDEARLLAIQAAIQARISDADAACSHDSLLPAGTITSGLVVIGDVQSYPQKTDAPVLFCVVGGGRQAHRAFDTRPQTIERTATGGFRVELHTDIFCYLHHELFTAASGTWAAITAQARSRELLCARLCDYIRADAFNGQTGFALTLASREFATSPAFDTLYGYVSHGDKGEFIKSFGGTQFLYGVHLHHTGTIL